MVGRCKPEYNWPVRNSSSTTPDHYRPGGAATGHPGLWAALYGGASALGYTGANCCLRAATNVDPVWVSAVKAFPTAAAMGVVLTLAASRGQSLFPPWKIIKALILAGLFGQLVGNVLFQYSLGVVGIGLAVPLCMGMIILASALLARFYLHESVTLPAVLSMAVLIVAIWVLSLGAGDAYQSIANQAPRGWLLLIGVAAACASGFAYAVLGVVIRYGLTANCSITATTFLVCLVGVIALGLWSGVKIGVAGMLATTPRDWYVMLAAGVFNLMAFLALARALQLMSVVYVNAVNASQVAMAAVAGVLFFREPLTVALAAGVFLTVLGLLLMPRKDRPQRPSHRSIDNHTESGVENPPNLVSNSASCPSSQCANSYLVHPSNDESLSSAAPLVDRTAGNS